MPTSKPELLKARDFSFYAGLQAAGQTVVIRKTGSAGTLFSPIRLINRQEIIAVECFGSVTNHAHFQHGSFVGGIANGLN